MFAFEVSSFITKFNEISGRTYMCTDCNAKAESDHASLFSSWKQSRLSSNISRSPDRTPKAEMSTFEDEQEQEQEQEQERGHRWFHSMILYQAVPETVSTPSMEERMESLENDFRSLETSVRERQDEFSERLERLEGMMSRILAAVLQTSGDSGSIGDLGEETEEAEETGEAEETEEDEETEEAEQS